MGKHSLFVSKPKKNRVQIGERYGRLVVTADLGTKKFGVNFVRELECLCDCGQTYVAKASHLRAGGTKSCGCLFTDPKRHLSLPSGEAAFRMIFRSYKQNAKNDARPFTLSEERFRYLVTQNCSYCGCEPSTVVRTRAGYGEFTHNGIDRVNNFLGYIDGNVVSCCGTCNIAKQAMELPVFLAWVERVYVHSVASRKTENIVRIVF